MSIKKLSLLLLTAVLFANNAMVADAAPAKTAKKQAAIQSGTKVRAKVEVSGLYDQECYDAFYGCMDQFCISDNENGGSCACSDLNAGYEKEILKIKDIDLQINFMTNYVGMDAKKMGMVLDGWKENQLLYFAGRKYERESQEYTDRIEKAIEQINKERNDNV